MKLSAQEEYGLRCLLRVASAKDGESVTIPAIAAAEGLSIPYVGKLMSILRQHRLVESVRGQTGGYVLSRPAEKIAVAEVLTLLGGRLFEPGFCDEFAGLEQVCKRSIDCSVRSLWRSVQRAVDLVLAGITLRDLLRKESEVSRLVTFESVRSRK
jgi:Rrf2 family protein